MNVWFSQTMVQGIGWTLVHFLWQGLVIAALLATGLRLLRRSPAHQRYLAGCAALLLMALAPLVTFQLVLKQDEPAPVPVVESTIAEATAPVESIARPAVMLPKIVVTATREARAPKAAWRLEPLLPWLVAAWLAGVGGLSCRLFAGWLQIRRLRRADAEALADGWPHKLAELARRLGVNRPLRLLRTARVEVPTVIGWLRPVILLPAACLAGLTPAQLESILLHELAHIRRHDYLINLLQSAVETLLFYHPAVWWVSRRIREERENCCDDLVVEACGDRVGYARALATLEELRPASAQLALAAGGAPLLQRIRRVLGQGERSAARPAWPLAGLLLVLLLAFAALQWRGHRAVAAGQGQAGVPNKAGSKVVTNVGYDNPGQFVPQAAVPGGSTITAVLPLPHFRLRQTITMLTGLPDSENSKIAVLLEAISTNEDGSVTWATQNAEAIPDKQTTTNSNNVRVNTLVQDGKSYFETGKYDEADAKFKQALKLDPANVPASQYEALILEKRDLNAIHGGGPVSTSQADEEWKVAQRARLKEPKPNSFNRTNLIYTGKGRQTIQDKLNRIRVATVKYDNVPLAQVLDDLMKIARDRDPDGKGVNFFFSRQPVAPGTVLTNPAGGLLVAGVQPDPEDVSQVKVHISLNDVRLADILDAIVKTADPPLNYTILDYAVEFSLRGNQPIPLETRTFQVDTNTFLQGLESATKTPVAGGQATTSVIQAAARTYFAATGVDLNTNTGKVVIFNDRRGTLTVRATSQDLDVIEGMVQALNKPDGQTNEPVVLETRTFRVNPNTFVTGLESLSGGPLTTRGGNLATNSEEITQALRRYFGTAGIDLRTNTGRVVLYNDRKGTLTIRASRDDLDLIEATIQGINKPVLEVNIKAKFVEITRKDGDTNGFQWTLGTFVTNKTGPAPRGQPPYVSAGSTPAVSAMDAAWVTNTATITGILTDPQFRTVLRALEQRDGVDMLTLPEVTTENGRPAQIQSVDVQSIVVNTNYPAPQTTNFMVKEMNFGPTLDVTPDISADEFTVRLTLIPSITEFLGYDNPGQFVPTTTLPNGTKVTSVLPLPHFRIRQVVTTINVWDAQTAVIGGFVPVEDKKQVKDKVPLLGDLPLLGRLFRSEHSQKTRKELLIFVTPTIINPDGTRYHTDAEMPFAKTSTPPQTGTNSPPKK